MIGEKHKTLVIAHVSSRYFDSVNGNLTHKLFRALQVDSQSDLIPNKAYCHATNQSTFAGFWKNSRILEHDYECCFADISFPREEIGDVCMQATFLHIATLTMSSVTDHFNTDSFITCKKIPHYLGELARQLANHFVALHYFHGIFVHGVVKVSFSSRCASLAFVCGQMTD